jgi:poly-gamma-glutamate capsule biosynthesis protein CapA/YwtB (metallophosphatase superfamily)
VNLKNITFCARSYHSSPQPLSARSITINRRLLVVLKRISILLCIVPFFLSCSLRTGSYVSEKTQKPDDTFRSVDRVTISAIGDIMVHGAQLKAAWNDEKRRYDFEPAFSQVKNLLAEADITIGNLETTLPGSEKLYSGYPRFGAPDALVAALKGAGVDILNTANNHACDKGKRGVIRTIDVLDAYGLLHAGTYRDKTAYETQRILIVERNHIRLAVLGYTFGVNDMAIPEGTYVNLIDQQQMASDIRLARTRHVDFIIVLLHWGTEYERYPNEFQNKIAAFLFSEGVDIILGGHPHVLQPFQLQSVADKYGEIRPRLVIYSLGNFISNQRDRYRDGGIIFNFALEKHLSPNKAMTFQITDVQYIPTWVYVDRTTDNNQFYILPVVKYLKNDQPLHVPDDAYQKMLTFYEDTQSHLQSNWMQEGKGTKTQSIEGYQ